MRLIDSGVLRDFDFEALATFDFALAAFDFASREPLSSLHLGLEIPGGVSCPCDAGACDVRAEDLSTSTAGDKHRPCGRVQVTLEVELGDTSGLGRRYPFGQCSEAGLSPFLTRMDLGESAIGEKDPSASD